MRAKVTLTSLTLFLILTTNSVNKKDSSDNFYCKRSSQCFDDSKVEYT